jgi:hypothetical protein
MNQVAVTIGGGGGGEARIGEEKEVLGPQLGFGECGRERERRWEKE